MGGGINKRDILGYVLCAVVLGVILLGPGHRYHLLDGHEIVHFGYLNDLRHGKLIVAETRMQYGPLLGLSIYWFMSLVGFDIEHFRLYWVLATYIFMLGAVFLLKRIFLKWIWVGLGLLLILFFTHVSFYLPDSSGLNSGFYGYANPGRLGFAFLTLLILFGRGGEPPSPLRCLIAGILQGACFFYAQESGLPAIAASVVYIFLVGRDKGASYVSGIAALLGGVGLFTFLFSLPYMLRGLFKSFVINMMEMPLMVSKGYSNTPFPSILEDITLDPLGAMTTTALFYWGPIIYLVSAFRVERRWAIQGLSNKDSFMFASAVFGLASFRGVLARSDSTHLLTVLLPAIILLLYLMKESREGSLSGIQRWIWNVGFVLMLLYGSVLSLKNPLLVAEGIWNKIRHFPFPPIEKSLVQFPHERGGRLMLPAEGSWSVNFQLDAQDIAAAKEIARVAGSYPVYIRVPLKQPLLYFLSGVQSATAYSEYEANVFLKRHFIEIDNQLKKTPPFLVVTSVPLSSLGGLYEQIEVLPGPYYFYVRR